MLLTCSPQPHLQRCGIVPSFRWRMNTGTCSQPRGSTPHWSLDQFYYFIIHHAGRKRIVIEVLNHSEPFWRLAIVFFGDDIVHGPGDFTIAAPVLIERLVDCDNPDDMIHPQSDGVVQS